MALALLSHPVALWGRVWVRVPASPPLECCETAPPPSLAPGTPSPSPPPHPHSPVRGRCAPTPAPRFTWGIPKMTGLPVPFATRPMALGCGGLYFLIARLRLSMALRCPGSVNVPPSPHGPCLLVERERRFLIALRWRRRLLVLWRAWRMTAGIRPQPLAMRTTISCPLRSLAAITTCSGQFWRALGPASAGQAAY